MNANERREKIAPFFLLHNTQIQIRQEDEEAEEITYESDREPKRKHRGRVFLEWFERFFFLTRLCFFALRVNNLKFVWCLYAIFQILCFFQGLHFCACFDDTNPTTEFKAVL